MKRASIATFVAALLLYLAIPPLVSADWLKIDLGDHYGCLDTETSAVWDELPHPSSGQATISCQNATGIMAWLSREAQAGHANAIALLNSILGSAEAATYRLYPVPRPDGVIDTSCLDGNCDPDPADFAWDDAALATQMTLVSSQSTGTATDLDVSPSCSGTDCASNVSYYLATAVSNWSMTTAGHLQHAGMATGSGSLQIKVCLTATPTICDASASFPFSYQDPPSDDTIAPSYPVDLIATPDTGKVTITGLVPSDPCTDVECEGIQDVQLQANGTGTLTTIATGPGLSYGYTLTNVGSLSPTPVATPANGGREWTFTNVAGTIDGTASKFPFESHDHSGRSIQGACITSITTGTDYAKVGRMASATTAAGSVYAAVGAMKLANGNTYMITQHRTATDAISHSVVVAIPVTLPVGLILDVNPASGQVTYRYSLGCGVEYTDVVAEALSFPSAYQVGLFATATTGDGGAVMSGTATNNFVSDGTRWSYEWTTGVGGTIAARSRDKAGTPNTGSYSGTISAIPDTPPALGAIKWHPGQGIYSAGTLTPPSHDSNYSSKVNQIHSDITTYCNDSDIVGIRVIARWAMLEGAQNDYSAGFALFDQILAWLAPCDMTLSVEIWDRTFGSKFTSTTSPGSVAFSYPAYIMTSTYGPCCSVVVGSGATGYVSNGGVRTTLANQQWSGGAQTSAALHWEPAIMDRLIALSTAYANRYDKNPNFLTWNYGGETAITTPGFTYPGVVIAVSPP